ncbi:MAG: shikimate kinase [Rhodobacteraceae bacterium]|nr:shikimate kinase [Paracoccaceae bacterium]
MSQNQHQTAPIGSKTLVLVGLMGAGKSSVGRRLADRLNMPFIDSDDAIEAAADLTIPEIFEKFGEQYFREGEERVIERLLNDPPCILATGGGAYLSEKTRQNISKTAVSVWLKADLETLWQRVSGKPGRPLLQAENPKMVLKNLIDTRYPIYDLADVIVVSYLDNPHEIVVDDILEALK